MRMRAEHPRLLAALLLLLGLAAGPGPSAAQGGAFLTTVGSDTFCFERWARHGNVVSGSWVVLHPPGVYVHDYRMTVGADGLPVHYTMKYSEPLADTPPSLDSVVIDYGRDTVTYRFISRDSTITSKVTLHEAFPFLGQSIVGLDLALRRLRAAHADSGFVVASETSNLVTPPRRLSVRFAGDSAYVGPATRVRLAPDGAVVDMNDGRRFVQPAPALDVPRLTKHFVDEYAPRVVALMAAAAKRVEISLPAAQLDRFVGSYGRGALAVTRDGEHLMLGTRQAKLTLLAMSQLEFFVRSPDLVLTFDLDANGAVQGVTVAQGESRQHLPRDN